MRALKWWIRPSARAALEPHASAPQEAGLLRGAHYTTYVEQVKQLRRSGQDQDAERLLLELIDAVEAEAADKGWGVAPWYYEQLAILYSKRGEPGAEIAILERYAAQPQAPGSSPSRLALRLAKKVAAREPRAGA